MGGFFGCTDWLSRKEEGEGRLEGRDGEGGEGGTRNPYEVPISAGQLTTVLYTLTILNAS